MVLSDLLSVRFWTCYKCTGCFIIIVSVRVLFLYNCTLGSLNSLTREWSWRKRSKWKPSDYVDKSRIQLQVLVFPLRFKGSFTYFAVQDVQAKLLASFKKKMTQANVLMFFYKTAEGIRWILKKQSFDKSVRILGLGSWVQKFTGSLTGQALC